LFGSVGTGPGPLKELVDAKLIAPAANINVRTTIRIAIFMINFLQLFVFFRIFAPESCE
jgi:hypothetical protein